MDAKGQSWDVFQTKTMPTNFLIEKGGKITAIAAGCDASGLIAQKVSEKAAKVVDTKAVDVKAKVDEVIVIQEEIPAGEPLEADANEFARFAEVTGYGYGRLGEPTLLYSARHGWRRLGERARVPGDSIRDRLLARLRDEGHVLDDSEPDDEEDA